MCIDNYKYVLNSTLCLSIFVTTPPGSTPPLLVLASSGSRTRDSGAGGGRSNKESPKATASSVSC